MTPSLRRLDAISFHVFANPSSFLAIMFVSCRDMRTTESGGQKTVSLARGSTVGKVIERGNAVGLGPHPDRTRSADPLIVELNVTLAIKRDPDPLTDELHAQRVPLVLGYRCIDIL